MVWLIILFDNLNCGISANKVFLGASTLEWVLSFCIITIVFFSSYFKWCENDFFMDCGLDEYVEVYKTAEQFVKDQNRVKKL